MKKYLLIFTSAVFALSSCSSFKSSGSGARVFSPTARVNISNNWELIPGDPIVYTIDISTAEGRQKLHNLTLKEAKELVLNEAKQKYGAVTIIDPNFTKLKKGKRKILRITLHGVPAYYKNAGYFNNQTEHANGNSNVNVRINQ